MFTSNDKVYGKRASGSHLHSGLRELVDGLHSDLSQGYNEDVLGRPRARTGHSSEPNVNYDAGHFGRRLPPHSSGDREYEEDQDQRKVRFRNSSRKMYEKDVEHDRSSGIRDEGGFDAGSSDSSGRGYGGLSGFAKRPQAYFRTPSEILTPPDFVKSSSEFAKSKSDGENKSHSVQLLNLRAALNEKELQLVELREQHIIVLNRAADARQSWEDALESKDRIISQLQRTLQHKKIQHDRQKWENQENLLALRKRQKQENAEVERKELKLALLEAKNAQFVQELVEQQKLITRMKHHVGEKEKLCANQFQKLETMNGRIQDLKSALQQKEDEAATQAKYCNELKTLLWKRDSIIAELQISEQQLQSSLAREEAAREAQAMSRENVQEEDTSVEKRLSEMQNQHKSLVNEASDKEHSERENHQSDMMKLMELKDNFNNVQESVVKDLNDKEGVMHKIQKRMNELQRSLRSKDAALSEKNSKYQEALLKIFRLTEDYEAMKQEYDELIKRNHELESKVAHLQYSDGRMGASVSEALTPPVEVLPYEFSLGGSTGEDLGFDDATQDSMESEQLSNASVYHANFEKIKITEVEMPDIDPQQQEQQHPATPTQPPQASFQSLSPERTQNPPPPSAATTPLRRLPLEVEEPPMSSSPPLVGPLSKNIGGLPSEFDANYNSIQDEIKKREQCWRKTEELMREALTRRLKLLGEAKEAQKCKTDVKSSAERGLKSHKRSGHLANHHHHLQAAVSTREYPDRKSRLEQGSRMHHRNEIDNDSRPDQHIPRRKALCRDGLIKRHGHDGSRGQVRQIYENDIYQLNCRMNHNVGNFKNVDVSNRQRYEQDMLTDRGERPVQNTHLDKCTKPFEHYGNDERRGHHGRSDCMRKGSVS